MVNRIVIVGGGTAGWMTASYMKAAFGDRVDITLVESGQVGTVGVGEATFSDIRHFFEFLGLKEKDWMPACNATYKLAVRFENWREKGHYSYHPFEQLRSVNGFPLTDWWLQEKPTGRFDKDCFVMASVIDAGLSPRQLDGTLIDQPFDEGADEMQGLTMSEHQGKTQFPYAYHFEAALLAKYLTKYAVDRGVRHIVDDVNKVDLDDRGWITTVRTAEHGDLTGDLFIDCTGFRGSAQPGLEEPFLSYQDTLPNDSAVASRSRWTWRSADLPAPPPPPRTRVDLDDPVVGRVGTGYVYASDYCRRRRPSAPA